MKSRWNVNLALCLSSLGLMASMGCGKDLSGTYKGSETISTQAQNGSSDVTITLNKGSDDKYSGTWTSGKGSGTLDGTANGDGLKDVTVNITPAYDPNQNNYGNNGNNGGYPYNGGNNNNNNGNQNYNYGQPCGGAFTGSISITNGSDLTATLITSGNSQSYCNGSRSVTAKKQ